MDIDRNAPVITRDEILITAPPGTIWNVQTNIPSWPTWQPEVDAASIDGPLAVGTVFHWQTSGLKYRLDNSGNRTSTAYCLERSCTGDRSGTRLDADTGGEWSASSHRGILRDGEPVRSQLVTMQRALDQSLRAWLENLKRTAEASTQS